ncbi:MAG: hypothetical protein NVS3B26_19070 [Mycobacteriales bacterium]
MRKSTTAIVLVGVLSISLSACGSSSSGTSAPKAAASPVASLANLTGEKTEVILGKDFVAGLTSLKVAPGVTGTAKLDATTGTVSFPITGGSATYYTPGSRTPYVESSIKHDGSGLSLTAGGKKVTLENFVVDAGQSKVFGDVSLDGKSVAKGAYLFFLDGRTLKPLDTTSMPGKGILFGTEVKLSKVAADLLDKTFNVTALDEFFPVGVARITLQLPK